MCLLTIDNSFSSRITFLLSFPTVIVSLALLFFHCVFVTTAEVASGESVKRVARCFCWRRGRGGGGVALVSSLALGRIFACLSPTWTCFARNGALDWVLFFNAHSS